MTENITLDEHRLWVIFHQAYDILTRCEEDAVNGAGITNQQFLVLCLMQFMSEVFDSSIIITDLAHSLFRSVNSISTIIDRMEQNGLVNKVRDMEDRRAIRLEVTPKGKEIFSKALVPSRSLTKQVFSVFTEDELETLFVLLKKLKTQVSIAGGVGEVKIDPELSGQEKLVQFLNRDIE
jgi:DNA-binding MarR family transcriptional regulator